MFAIHTYTHARARTHARTYDAALKAGTIFIFTVSCKQSLILGQQAMPNAKYFHFNKYLCSTSQSSELRGF
jgi:hypothetical protein